MKPKDAQPPRRTEERFKTVAQVLAILVLVGMMGMLLHKGHADVTTLAQQNPGESFWPALVRHVLRNLAGG